MYELICEICGNIAVALLYCYFCVAVLKCRNRWLAVTSAVSVMGVVAPIACKNISSQLSFLIAHLLFIMFTWFFFEGKIIEKILAYSIGYMTINFTLLLEVNVFNMIRGIDSSNSYFLSLGVIALGMPLLFLISRTWKSISFLLSNIKAIGFFLLPVSQFLLVFFNVYFLKKVNHYENYIFELSTTDLTFAIIYIAIFVISLFADGYFLKVFEEMAADVRERERLQYLEKESQMTYDYIKTMEDDVAEMRRYRHDLLNLLTTVSYVIESGDESGRTDAINIVQQMTQEINELSGARYCRNNLVNCILAHEKNKMKKDDIDCDFRAEIEDELHVSELDLCRLLTNLLDNAAESCCRVEDTTARWVHSNMRVDDGFLYITVRNTCPQGAFELKSSKKDKENHGLGVGIIREIVSRYNGELILSAEGNTVTATAALEWK